MADVLLGVLDVLDVLTGIGPSSCEDPKKTYRAPKIRFVFLILGVVFFFGYFPAAFFSPATPKMYLRILGLGGSFFLLVWMVINVYSFLTWRRIEKKRWLRELEIERERYAEEKRIRDGIKKEDAPDWLAKIWDGRVVDDPKRQQ